MILEKELDCYYKKLLSLGKVDTENNFKSIPSRIQEIVKTLL